MALCRIGIAESWEVGGPAASRTERKEAGSMNPILADMYATVAPSAPFIIAAYAIVWLALLAYVVFALRGLKKTEAQMALLEEAVAKKTGSGAA